MAQSGFNQLISDSRAAQGSVFDTLWDKALRFGTSDPMGGVGPQASVAGPSGIAAAGWLRSMAKRFAGKDPQKQADLIQTAMEAVHREGGTLDPRNAMRAAKVSMLTATRPEGGTGARTGLTQQISKIQGQLGELGDFRLRSELNKLRPKAEQLSLDQVRNARAKIGLRAHQRPGSLEDLENVARNTDNPETAAILQQGIDRLTPAQQLNIRKHMAGETINPQILKRIQDKFKGGKTTPAKPISGGAGDQFTQPSHPAFTPRSLYVIKQELEPGSGLSMSPRDLVTRSREMNLGPQGETFYGQPSYPPGARPGIDAAAPDPIPLRTSPQLGGPGGRVLQDPYGTIPGSGENMGLMSKDTIKPGPYPKQSIGGFQQLQRMIMDALLNSGRN